MRSMRRFLSCFTDLAISSCCLVIYSHSFFDSMRNTFIALLISRKTLRFFCSVRCFHSSSCSFKVSMSPPIPLFLSASNSSNVLDSMLTIRLLQSYIFWLDASLKPPHSSFSPPKRFSIFYCLSFQP